MRNISVYSPFSVAVALFALMTFAAPAGAEVVDKSASGFTLKTTVQITAPPDRVYGVLVDIGSWWGTGHTYSGDARNMTIVAQPGGCFCEELPNGGGVEHGRVVNVVPGRLLRIHTALGPLQELGVAGSMSWQIAAGGQGSTLTMTYVVGGYMAGGLDKIADAVDKVLAEQIGNLKTHAEKNK